MIAGHITFEDHTIQFRVNYKTNTVDYTVIDSLENTSETFENVPQDKFFKALSIMVHNDGMPDYKADYQDAESIMGKIRWIP